MKYIKVIPTRDGIVFKLTEFERKEENVQCTKNIVPFQDPIFRVFCHHPHDKEEISCILVTTYGTDCRKAFVPREAQIQNEHEEKSQQDHLIW